VRSPGFARFTETGSRRVVARGHGQGNGGLVFNGDRISAGKIKKFWIVVDSSDNGRAM
jgi:hypothetical protein